MKKIFVLILILLNSSFMCYANFLDDSPSRYLKAGSNNMLSVFVDVDSVSVERYEPPYYIVRINIFTDNYYKNEILQYTLRNFYNSDNQIMSNHIYKINAFDDHGNLKYNAEITPDAPKELTKNMPGYLIANIAFFKAYKMYFTKDYQEKYNTEMIPLNEIANAFNH